MSTLLNLSGLILAVYAGFTSLPWYFIFISAGLLILGWVSVRIHQIPNILSEGGMFALPKIIFYQMVIYSIVTAPTYYIASLFS
jgi:hypothetical protein